MFLGVIVFALVAILLAILALRAIRALTRGSGKGQQQQTSGKSHPQAESRKKGQTTEKEESEKEEVQKDAPKEDLPEETRSRYAASLSDGISEASYLEDTSFRIDEKATADECISGSALSYIEYNNRELAGKDYFGFNLIVEDDARMVLTYNGCAVATLTKIERETTAIINGEPVTGTIPAYRTNTFPPELKEGMVTGDLEKILEASGRIKACAGDPEAVSAVMREYFTQGENVSKLRRAIDRKIQMKESSRRQKQDSAQRKTPKRILPR